MKERVLLIQPNTENCTSILLPINLGYISSYLKKNGVDSYILDCLNNKLSIKYVLSFVNKYRPSMIGISVMTSNFFDARKLISSIKQHFRIPIVVGGSHPSGDPMDTMAKLQCDYVVFGEGEQTLLELVQNKDKKHIFGLCYKSKDKIIINKPRELIKDLDSLPFPNYEQINPNSYKSLPHQLYYRQFPIAPVITSRGCSYGCKYCFGNTIFGRTIRFRSAKNVVDEIEFLVKRFGVKEIFIEDDNFTLGKKHAYGVCQEILDRNIKINWALPNGVRLEYLDAELLRIMRKSGCYSMSIGIESGNQEILDSIDKRLDLKIIKEKIKLIKSFGFKVRGFFILGFPKDTKKTMNDTIKFAKGLDCDYYNFHSLQILPGTRLHHELGYYDNFETLLKSKSNLVKKMVRKAIITVNLRPRIVLNNLRAIKIRDYFKTFILIKKVIIPSK